MNYQQYLEIKEEVSHSIKLFGISYHLPTLMALVQCALLVFRIDMRFDYINMFVLDSLFSFAYQRMAVGNYVFAAVFYAAFAFIIGTFVYTSVGILFFEKKRPSYKISMLIYSVDAVLWIGVAGILQFLLHVAILVPMFVTYKKHRTLETMEKNLWG
ncbi:MAG: hypothetical protein IKM61_01785 [Eubacteriaceae bacterium]|nr:hypothetical protein [Eubacteriaceae bacterium]